jgi:hypothetical protein
MDRTVKEIFSLKILLIFCGPNIPLVLAENDAIVLKWESQGFGGKNDRLHGGRFKISHSNQLNWCA